jgi:hypothetical protein
MATGYLTLASERRVLIVQFDSDDHYSMEWTIGAATVEHGTTFWTEDQLLVDGGPSDAMAMHYRVQGVPFPFYGNGLLVGTDPAAGDIADRPAMELDEFRRLVSFTGHIGSRQAQTVPHGAAQCDE